MLNSAIDFIFHVIDYIKSKNLSDVEALSKAYEIVTFRSLSKAEKKDIQNSIEEYGYEKTKLSMLSLWFNSEAYEASYDYSKQKFVGQSWYQFEGFLKGMKNTQIANAKVELYSGENQLAEVLTDSMGKYELSLQISDSFRQKKMMLKFSRSQFEILLI